MAGGRPPSGRVPRRAIAPVLQALLLLPGLLLGGCVHHYWQDEAGSHPEAFVLQSLMGRRFAARQPLTAHQALRAELLPKHGLPVQLSAPAWEVPRPSVAYRTLLELPVGTRLELVGESGLYNPAVGTLRYGYFIVHDVPAARELLLPVAAEAILRAVHGVSGRRAAAPWLLPVAAPSQWNRARYRDIEAAAWHASVDLNLDTRAMPPAP